MPAFSTYTEEEKITYVGEAHNLCKIVEDFGCKTHLQFGALLGLVRQNSLIDTDTDIDIAVISNESKPEKVIQEAARLFNYLKDKVHIWRYFDEKGNRKSLTEIKKPFGQVFIQTESKNIVDLSFVWINNGDYWHCIWGNLFKFQGLDKGSLYGYEFSILKHPELLFERIYGNDWMTPTNKKAHHFIRHQPILYNLTH